MPRDFTGSVRTFPRVLQRDDWQCTLRASSKSVLGEIDDKDLCSRFVTGNVAVNLSAQQLGHVWDEMSPQQPHKEGLVLSMLLLKAVVCGAMR